MNIYKTPNNGFCYGEIVNGRKVILTGHACERAVERLSAMGIRYEATNDYYETALNIINNAITNPFMDKYLNNMFIHNKNHKVICHDTRTKMVFVIAISTEENAIYSITFGEERNKKWVSNVDTGRMCWIYPDAFKFSTMNGNITWI